MPAAGRLVEVDVRRLPGWMERFAQRHGTTATTVDDGGRRLVITAADGARADVTIPYAPLTDALSVTDPVQLLVDHVRAPRTVGLLLVRRGGWAVGTIEAGVLIARDTGGGYVQGRTKAGGWSQQRYARRRGNQAEQVWQRAADGAADVLLPHRHELSAVVTGGDRTGVDGVLTDHRLRWLTALVEPRFLDVGDPSRAVLDDAVRRLQAVVITLNALA